MAKPSIFSSNYKERNKKRRINLFLFILLIISITFFGGKYYLSKHNVPIINNIANSKIVKNISHFDLIAKIKQGFAHKAKPDETKSVAAKQINSGVAVSTQSSIKPNVATRPKGQGIENKSSEYIYHGLDGKSYYVEYQNVALKVEITGFKDDADTSEYSISQDKSKIVFDAKADNNLVICDSLGNFKVISRVDYKMKSTGEVISKETILSEYKDYIWAQKPCFTLDGRIIYVSRLPYIRKDDTLYLWSMNIDGSNNKKITILNHDISKLSYDGYDDKNRLRVIFDGVEYYIDNGSYMLNRE
jgi:hypothetical protein